MIERKIELRSAYEWTCEGCGRDNFTRALPWELTSDDVESLGDLETAKSLIRRQVGNREDSGRFTVSGCRAPEQVTCDHCGATFDTLFDVGFDIDPESEAT